MKNISSFLSEKSQFLEVKFSVYLKWRVFVMISEVLLYQLYEKKNRVRGPAHDYRPAFTDLFFILFFILMLLF